MFVHEFVRGNKSSPISYPSSLAFALITLTFLQAFENAQCDLQSRECQTTAFGENSYRHLVFTDNFIGTQPRPLDCVLSGATLGL